MCEPIAFQGVFMGVDVPTAEMLRCRVGEGLTGWVAEHNESIVIGDAENDDRGTVVGPTDGPESMLLVPMTYDDRVEGVIVLAKLGRNRFSADHEATLSIFAGHAAQAFVNADNTERVRRQQLELELQLASQRRLLEVNETLLSTLDPHAVLEMIADSLKAVVAYDALTIYRVDREAAVRRAVVARDRFADVIMEYVGPLGVGITGWVIDRNEAVLSNDAHLDSRSIQIPGTPFEPESMIVVPLAAGGEVIGTLNIARMGLEESHFSANEFELTKLFAGQASIALQNAEIHRAVEVRAELDSLTGLRNHGAFQRELGEAIATDDGTGLALLMMDLDAFKAFNDANGHPAGDDLLRRIGVAITGVLREGDRAYRYGGDEFAVVLPAMGHAQAEAVAARIRAAVAEASEGGAGRPGPAVTISIGVATFPHDGRTKDALVRAADVNLYQTKPSRARTPDGPEHGLADAYLAALNETAVALMDRLDPTDLLATIVHRAGDLVGTPHGFVYLVDADAGDLVMEVGTGLYADYIGHRLARGMGVSGAVWDTRAPMVAPDYDALPSRDPGFPTGLLGAVVGIPLVSDDALRGVLGLASGELEVTFGPRQVEVLGRFAELASLALDNAHLLQSARHEIFERRRAEEALRVSEERYRRLSDATSEALAIHRDGIVLEVNAAFCRLLGYEPEACVGRTILDFCAPETVAAIRSGEFSPESAAPMEVVARHHDGTTFPVEVSWRLIPYPDGEPANVVSIRDLRERQRLEAELSRSALYDRMTGLPNRALLLDRAGHSLSWTRQGEDDPVALILLDLDRFKLINESLGHATGDRVLEAVARRLEGCLRPGDTVARFGGDEFAVLLDGVRAPDEGRAIAERIDGALREPFDLDGREAFVTASMGIAFGVVGQTEPGDLLRDADVALYRAKADAASRQAVFEPGMSSATAERLDLENDLRRAVERDELRLDYQPLVDLATDGIVGIEALVRWQHPVRGLVPPMSFIPLAEETGLILPVGRWVLETACRQARTWQDQFPAAGPVVMSVNLSARQFAQPGLGDEVAAILAGTGLDPASLELEITESVLMDESEAGTRSLRELRELGVKLALDDFGTGYSSLSYLKHLPLDALKIDRTFIAELTGADDTTLPIVEAVIALAHGLGIEVVAEGIETAEQLSWLRRLSCDLGQGYYLARPLPADELAALLAAGRTLPRGPGVARRVPGRVPVAGRRRAG
jgi:diguanylate cyclase (GGDEF)-like protein/PAS domain S-box-containing protein